MFIFISKNLNIIVPPHDHIAVLKLILMAFSPNFSPSARPKSNQPNFHNSIQNSFEFSHYIQASPALLLFQTLISPQNDKRKQQFHRHINFSFSIENKYTNCRTVYCCYWFFFVTCTPAHTLCGGSVVLCVCVCVCIYETSISETDKKVNKRKTRRRNLQIFEQ